MKTAMLALALLSTTPAFGAEAESTTGKPDCKIVNPSPKPRETASWSGACKDGYADGAGTLIWTVAGLASSHFEGDLQRGRPHGNGYLRTADGRQYEGGFREGKRDGMGVELGLDGERYDGSWKAGNMDGIGSKTYSTGGRYDGAWQAGLRHGKGRATYGDGSVVEGDFVDGVLAGQMPSPRPARTRRYQTRTGGVGSTWIKNLNVPPEKPWAAMNRTEQALVRDAYLLVRDDDEPPYPLAGMKAVYVPIFWVQQKLQATGMLRMNVLVDREGNASSVTVFATPGPAVTKYATYVVMKEKYKPAVCAGKPCAMVVRYVLDFKME